MFYFNTEPRKWNKNVLAAKIILFHFRLCDVWNEIKSF